MYGIFTYIYHKIHPNVGKYTYMDGMGMGGKRQAQQSSTLLFETYKGEVF